MFGWQLTLIKIPQRAKTHDGYFYKKRPC